MYLVKKTTDSYYFLKADQQVNIFLPYFTASTLVKVYDIKENKSDYILFDKPGDHRF
jgi:hypothetical protein